MSRAACCASFHGNSKEDEQCVRRNRYQRLSRLWIRHTRESVVALTFAVVSVSDMCALYAFSHRAQEENTYFMKIIIKYADYHH